MTIPAVPVEVYAGFHGPASLTLLAYVAGLDSRIEAARDNISGTEFESESKVPIRDPPDKAEIAEYPYQKRLSRGVRTSFLSLAFLLIYVTASQIQSPVSSQWYLDAVSLLTLIGMIPPIIAYLYVFSLSKHWLKLKRT